MTDVDASRLTALEATIQELADKTAIRELTARYNQTFDSGDAEGFADCWTEDGQMTHRDADGSHGGRQAFIESCHAYDTQVIHTTTDPVITVDGDTAVQDCSFIVYTRSKDRTVNDFFMTGRYHDNLVRTPTGWKFHQRETSRDQVAKTLYEALGVTLPTR